jgi:hypothetical protein
MTITSYSNLKTHISPVFSVHNERRKEYFSHEVVVMEMSQVEIFTVILFNAAVCLFLPRLLHLNVFAKKG